MERDDTEVEAFVAEHGNPVTREELLKRLLAQASEQEDRANCVIHLPL